MSAKTTISTLATVAGAKALVVKVLPELKAVGMPFPVASTLKETGPLLQVPDSPRC